MDKAKFLSFFQKPRKKAFTLVEILTVVGIILIMAAAVVPAINSFLMNSRDSQRRADLEKLKVALQVYYTYNDSYIALDESGNWFSTEENTDFQQILNSQYIDRIPEDPLYPQTDDSGEAYSYYYQASTSDTYTLCAKSETKGGYFCVDQNINKSVVQLASVEGLGAGETSDGWIKVAGGGYTIKAGVGYSGATGPINGRKVVRDFDGNLHCVWTDKRGSYNQIYYAKSIDGGENWNEIALTTGENNQNFPSIAIDSNNNIHIVWAGFVNSWSQIRYIKYTTSWQPIENLTSENYDQQYSFIAIDNNNYLHIAWHGKHPDSASYNQIRYIKYTTSWQNIENLTIGNYHQYYPSIAIDSNGYVHIVWSGTYSGSTIGQIRYIKNTGFWQSIENLTSEEYGQFSSSIAIDSNNNIHIVWTGKHPDSASYNQIRYIKYTTSWQPIENLTSGSGGWEFEGYDQSSPSLIWQNDSNNIPSTGYAFIWTAGEDGYTVKYYASDDLK